jgi:peroxiredoxin
MFKVMNGDPAPEIVLPDTAGNTWRLSDRRGKMVVLHFCRGEF